MLISLSSFAQRYGKNIPRFQYKHWHFGTMLGTNTTSYDYRFNTEPLGTTKINHISIKSRAGLAIHIPVVSYNAHETVHFRVIPSISFHETLFTYKFNGYNGEEEELSTINESVNLNFPLLLKVSTKRINNFSAYAIGGASYSIDLASQEDVNQNLGDPIIKLKKHDWQYHVGGGFDFYLPYFKFGLELKTSRGLNNLLIQDNTFFADPLSSLKSRMWWFSITFEG